MDGLMNKLFQGKFFAKYTLSDIHQSIIEKIDIVTWISIWNITLNGSSEQEQSSISSSIKAKFNVHLHSKFHLPIYSLDLLNLERIESFTAQSRESSSYLGRKGSLNISCL